MVGMTRFERATPSSQARCATKLRHIPTGAIYKFNIRIKNFQSQELFLEIYIQVYIKISKLQLFSGFSRRISKFMRYFAFAQYDIILITFSVKFYISSFFFVIFFLHFYIFSHLNLLYGTITILWLG